MSDTPAGKTRFSGPTECDTFWGSHGCQLERGHDGHHNCCCECVDHPDPGSLCVGTHPYYGPSVPTYFFGADAPEGSEMP